jgi:recombination protein RecT
MSEANAKRPIDEVRDTLSKMGSQFKAVMPTQQHVDRYIRVVMTAVQQNMDLIAQETDRQSFYAACMKCAQDGLTPDGKEAVLKIYNTKVGNGWVKTVAYEPMAEGLLKKLRLSGEVIGAPKVHVVYARDEFVYELGDNERSPIAARSSPPTRSSS